ncbi:hypothetical protein ACFOM8_01990 [Paracoccus angustae]|uniref:HAMP domain-containing protein n=1 Tax=Paracoccus angustae TaxID=1671480 RepID=A0ABV7TZQ1_9RHOB
MDVGNLTITVDTSGITEATEALNKLAQAVERVNAALAMLNGKDHGGITVEIVGSLVHAEAKAAPTEGLNTALRRASMNRSKKSWGLAR